MEIELQKIVLPKETVCDCEELYYRKIGIPTSDEIYRDQIVLQSHQRIAFDTYFNGFSVLKWIKYTYANSNFKLKIKIKGIFLISLIHMWIEDGGKVQYRTLNQEKINSPEVGEFAFPYVTDNPWGSLAFVIESCEDGGVFYEGAYIGDIKETERQVKLGIGICTFKREEYVKNNINNLNKYIFNNENCIIKDKLEIFISDNAQTLGNIFDDNPHIHLVQNKNSGGSGGFTRCMIEALKYNEENGDKLTHLLLMDDDVKFDPAAIIKTYRILTLLKPQYIDAFIGGAMFKMSDPNIQHASGEFWHGDRCESFVETYNNNRNMINIKDILENENFTNANYQAWWYCAVPMSAIRYDNLALPFFIKSDDIEFSIRNLNSLILMNGINVWHESFESKYSAPNEYYTVRNYLVSAAVHGIKVSKERILTLLNGYFKHYVCNYKYLEIEHFCNAINDFVKGVDYFKSIDLAELHKKIAPLNYKMVPVSELPVDVTDDQYYRDISFDPHWSKFRKRIAKYTINGLFLSPRGYAVLGMWGGSYEQTFRKKFLVRYEVNSKRGFILQRSVKKFIHSAKLYIKTRKNILKYYDRAKAEFFDRKGELWNFDLWRGQLKLDK